MHSDTPVPPCLTGMIRKIIPCLLAACLVIPLFSASSEGRSQPVRNLETRMEIPEIRAVKSSEAHLYVLSDREGLVVFRIGADSLRWLYSSSGLANRGDRLISDIRFSYLFGRDGRLTVIEPTSVLGVYSSTQLPDDPVDVVRIGNDLFLAALDNGLLRLSLETPESVDKDPDAVFSPGRPIQAVESISRQLFALDDRGRLYLFENDSDGLTENGDFQLPRDALRLYTVGNRLYMSTTGGAVYRIRSDGRSDELFRIDEEVTDLKRWNDNYLIRGESSRIWIARQGLRPTLFREDPAAGNHLTVSKDQLWISTFRELCRWEDASQFATLPDSENPEAESGESDTADPSPDTDRGDMGSGELRIAPVNDQIIPYPRPLLLTLELESDHDPGRISFQQRSHVEGIRIQGNGFYWQPSSTDIGTHRVSVIAAAPDGQVDSTSFTINVRPFNSPPRFSPVRSLSIPIDEEFTIPIQATDPDGSDANLVRYIGVDLPDGATLDEQSGRFQWKPTRRQTGEHEFQVIATDQFGAASSMNIIVNVIDLTRGD